MLRRPALILLAASCLSLQACWVPQVISGVRPQLFEAATPSATPFADVTLEGKLVTLSTRLISIAKRTSTVLSLTADLAAHRQALESHLYYNVKTTGAFSGWVFTNGIYSSYDSQSGSRYSLSLIDKQNKPSSFDVLGFGSYGQAPLPATSFPANITQYQLQMQQPDVVAGDSLMLNLAGTWPVQIPLRDSFTTVLSGTGSDSGHPVFHQMDLQINGKTSSDGSLIAGQISFTTEIDGHIYNGFGGLDSRGLTGTVQIEQNGLTVAKIIQRDKRWDVEINDRVAASGN